MLPFPSLPWFELARFRRNRLSMAALVAVAIVPLFYGVLYVWANWNPTGNLDRVHAAVVNLDQPVTTTNASTGKKQVVPLGRSLAGKLTGDKSKKNFDWELTDAHDAAIGLANGDYGAVVTIPKNFSAAATSTGGTDGTKAQQARLDVSTNDAQNYLVGTIARSVGSAATDTLNAQVTGTYLDNVYISTSDLHTQMGQAAAGATTLSNGTGPLASGASTAHNGVLKLVSGLDQLKAGTSALPSQTSQLSQGAQQVSSGADRLAAGTSQLSSGLKQLQQGTASLPSDSRKLAAGAAQVSSGAAKLATGAGSLSSKIGDLSTGASDLSDGAKSLATKLNDYSSSVTGLSANCAAAGASADYCAKLAKVAAAGAPLGDGAAELSNKAAELSGGATKLGAGATKLSTKAAQLSAGAKKLHSGAAQLAAKAPQLKAGIAKSAMGAATINTHEHTLATGSAKVAAGNAQLASKTPALSSGIASAASGADQLSTGTAKLATGAKKLDDGATKLSTGLAEGAKKIPSYTPEERQTLSKVAATPVLSDIQRVNAVVGNGAGLAPYFMSLALWVGAMAIYMLLRALSVRALASTASSWRVAASGLIPGAVLSIIQAVLLVAVLEFVVGVDAVRLPLLVMFAVLVALTFTAVNQALIATFGGVGRFIALIFVSLQLSSAGGTYPIATAPAFFQAVHVILPMSYAVQGMRDCIAGGGSGVGPEVMVLLVWLVFGFLVTVIAAQRQRTWSIYRLHATSVV